MYWRWGSDDPTTSNAIGQSVDSLLGSWSGSGQVAFKGAARENIKCKAYNTRDNSQLKLVIRCASASYRIEIRSKLRTQGDKLLGEWEERTYNATGDAKGSLSDGLVSLSVSGGGFNGDMTINYDATTMTVAIAATGINMQSVRITLARMAK